MAETLRTYAQMLTVLADNSAGEISAADLRSSLASLTQLWGSFSMYQRTNFSLISGEAIVTYDLKTASAAPSGVLSGTAGTGRWTVPTNGNGYYRISYGGALEPGRWSGDGQYSLSIYRNGSVLLNAPSLYMSVHESLGGIDSTNSVAGEVFVLCSDGDIIDMRLDKVDGSSDSTVDMNTAFLLMQRMQ